MTPTIYITITALILAVILTMALIVYRVISKADFVLFTGFGKTYCFDIPFKKESQITLSPYIQPINEFLLAFIDSEEARVQFTADDIQPNSVVSPLLHSLKGLEYERVRNRLRAMASLNPVVNINQEQGTIDLQMGQPSGKAKRIKLRSLFPPKGQSILLEKL